MTKISGKRFRNILLVGMPGTGKSTFGKTYAYHTKRSFLDFDRFVEQLAGKSIQQIFAEDGEAVFRDLEDRALRKLERRQNTVISLGGGTICSPEKIAFAHQLGFIVHLFTELEALGHRLFPYKDTRPLLAECQTEEAVVARIRELWQARKVFYERADLTLDTQYSSPDALKIELAMAERRIFSREYQRDVAFVTGEDAQRGPDLFLVSSGLLPLAGSPYAMPPLDSSHEDPQGSPGGELSMAESQAVTQSEPQKSVPLGELPVAQLPVAGAESLAGEFAARIFVPVTGGESSGGDPKRRSEAGRGKRAHLGAMAHALGGSGGGSGGGSNRRQGASQGATGPQRGSRPGGSPEKKRPPNQQIPNQQSPILPESTPVLAREIQPAGEIIPRNPIGAPMEQQRGSAQQRIGMVQNQPQRGQGQRGSPQPGSHPRSPRPQHGPSGGQPRQVQGSGRGDGQRSGGESGQNSQTGNQNVGSGGASSQRNHQGPREGGPRMDGPREGGPRRGFGPRPPNSGPRMDGPRIDGPRIDGPRIDGPRMDGPRMDGPRMDGPRMDGSSPEKRVPQLIKPRKKDPLPPSDGGTNSGSDGGGSSQS